MGQRWAPGANQFVIQLNFLHGTEVGIKSKSVRNTIEFLSRDRGRHQNDQFVWILRFSRGRGGTKGETDCQGLEFLSWGRGEHQERIILSGVKFLPWDGGGDWRGAWRICMARH